MNDEDPRPDEGPADDASLRDPPPSEDEEHWVDDWKLDQRMFLAVGLPILLLVLGAVTVAVQAEDIEDAEQSVTEERLTFREAEGLDDNFTRVVEAAHAYVLSGDTQNRSRLDSRIGALQSGIEDYEASPQRQSSFMQFRENATTYVEITRRAQGRIEAEDPEAAREILTSPAAGRARSNAEAGVQLLIEGEQRDVQQARQELEQAHASLDSALMLGTVGAVLVSSLVGYDVTRRTRSTVGGLSDTIDEGLDELAVAHEQERSHLDAQSARVDEARRRIDDVGASVEDEQVRVDQALQQVDTVEQATRQGIQRIEATLDAVDATDANVTPVTERILDIAEEVDQLEEVAREMDGIAGEIDMLALNAALEASRAGLENHGMNEIRDLAERSQTRAQRLEEIATNAQQDGESAAMALEQSGKSISRTREGAHSAIDALVQAGDFLEDSLAEAQRMRELASQQSQALEEVTEELNQAQAEVENLSKANERAQRLTDELDELSRALQAMS